MTLTVLLAVGMVIIGLLALWKGADWLVDGASGLAKAFGVPTIVIGLTIVAFGTSLPELIVSLQSALQGEGAIAYGNVLGSNIANVFLILGLTAMLRVLPVTKNTVRIEIPFAIVAALLMLFFTPDGVISQHDGLILFGLFVVFFIYTLKSAKSGVRKCLTAECIRREKRRRQKMLTGKKTGRLLAYIVGGLILLALGGNFTVEGAKSIAAAFGLSEILIGLTIVAVGTSLPELVTSIVGALKRETDIVVGNIVGSNIFNTFWILATTSMISPITVNNAAQLQVDLLFNVATFVLVFLFVFIFRQKKHNDKAHSYQIARWEGLILLLCYVAYMYVIIRRELL